MSPGSARPMTVRATAVHRGPHLYSATPVVRIELHLGALEDWPTNPLEGFAGRLMAELPGPQDHGCCFGEPGGFLRRMQDGPGSAMWPSMWRWSCSRGQGRR